MEELRILLGAQLKEASSTKKVTVRKNAQYIAPSSATSVADVMSYAVAAAVSASEAGKTIDGANKFPSAVPAAYQWINLTNNMRGNQETTGSDASCSAGDKIRFFWAEDYNGENNQDAVELTISPSKFPGTLSQLYSAPSGERKKANKFGELLEIAA